MKKISTLEASFDTLCIQVAPDLAGKYHSYHRFHSKRRFELDRAFPDVKVGIELHGGTWKNGRHTRGAGFRDDRIKMNLAIECGWVVLEVTTDMLESNPAAIFEQLRNVLKQRGMELV